jgi:hypothetical protein
MSIYDISNLIASNQSPQSMQEAQSTATFSPRYERALPQRLRTRMTQIARIFTDTFYLFPIKEKIEPSNNNQAHSWLNLLKNKPQINADERRFVNLNIQHLSEVYKINSRVKVPQKSQSIATIIFASFAFFAVRFIKNFNKLTSIVQPSAFLCVHPQLIYRTAPAEGR